MDDLSAFDCTAVLGLEITTTLPLLQNISLRGIEYLAIGGESVTLRQRDWPIMAQIATENDLCLTTEAALAIALYDLSRRLI